MKRTYWKVEQLEGGQWTASEKITCEVTGEMNDHTKVWTEIKTGKQYFCFRMKGIYYFMSR